MLSSNDGACIARSSEAKDLCVQMVQPWFQVRHLQKSHGLLAISANFELYADMSARMMAIASRYAPNVVQYSIDEAFIDFSGMPGNLTAASMHLRAAVLQELPLPTSVGIAPTKTLAKLANHIAKTCDRKPRHHPQVLSRRLAQVCNTAELTAAELEALMAATEVGEVWGVGRKIAAQLNAGGVYMVRDLVRADVATLKRQFSMVFEKSVLELRGTACMGVEEAPGAKQADPGVTVFRQGGDPLRRHRRSRQRVCLTRSAESEAAGFRHRSDTGLHPHQPVPRDRLAARSQRHDGGQADGGQPKHRGRGLRCGTSDDQARLQLRQSRRDAEGLA